MIEKGEMRTYTEQFHVFVDWISKEENIDLIGLEL